MTPETLRGQFLVAGRRLRDTNFYRSVVLMIEHGAEGAMGVVVNHPSRVTVAKALSEHFPMIESEELVYIGGPVEPAALFILHTAGDLDDAERPIVPGIYAGSSAEVFERVVESIDAEDSPFRFRIFCGCAGWGPGQLEGELARGDWHVHPASEELVLTEDPYSLWDTVLQQISARSGILPHTSPHPDWN